MYESPSGVAVFPCWSMQPITTDDISVGTTKEVGL